MIGIVGGVGALAGIDVSKKIIEETQVRTDQDHVPMVLLSIPESVPDRTQYLIGAEKTNPAFVISQLLVRLEQAGAVVGAIPCNTAHAEQIFSVVQKELQKVGSQLKLLSMVEECTAYLKQRFPSKVIGMLSTKGTKLAGIYRNAFEQAGIRIIEPVDSWQERIHSAIYDTGYGIKAFSSPVKEKARKELYEAIEVLIKSGAEVIVLGCTEIPLAIMEIEIKGIPLIDPNRILARALIKEIAPEKLRSEEYLFKDCKRLYKNTKGV